MFAAHRHGNGASDTGLDMNDKTFFLVANENGQCVLIRRENAKNFHADNIRIHKQGVAPLTLNDNVVTTMDTFLTHI